VGGANDVLELEVKDEGAEPAEVAATGEAAAAVHSPVGTGVICSTQEALGLQVPLAWLRCCKSL